ncbi:MAG: hypothetical protein H6736_12955 [Alphaproteobacteria bacterium]|nr:hypothetical protein [Alphaproteobacteria bacterium]MCB9692712.1 hypothetical protein [Alphaproteobacteria bacterium]
MISLLLATALAEPDVEVSVGGGIFAPARRAWNVSPTLDGQVDVGGLVPEAPMLLATANAELGFYAIYGCEQCNLLGRWALGVGPTVTTEWVDVTLLGRLRGLGNNVNIRPALQATGRVQAGDLALRPYFQVDGVRYVDMEAGLRVVVGGSDGTRTRAQQCEEGTLRELEGPVVAGSVTGIAPFGTEAVKVDFGDVYANPLVNALGQIKDTVGEYLAALGIYQSSKALGAGEAGLSDFAGRAQDIAGKNGWDWAIPLSAADLPGALATIELEIGKRAIDALIPHLEAYREQFAFGIDVAYHKRTTSFECVPVQVCEDGWWKDAGWTQRGESVVTDGRVITKRFRAPEGNTPQGRTARMWRMIGQWYRSMNPAGPEYVKRLEDPCGVADVFHTDVEVESGPEQESCEGWLKERAALQSERRALVGSWLDLHTEQLEWASGQAKQDCEDARASAAANARSAEVQAEIAGIAGDATSRGYAADLATRAEEARAHADALCGWAGKVDQRLGESKADVEGRPGRLEAIDAELAALEERIATCDLVE